MAEGPQRRFRHHMSSGQSGRGGVGSQGQELHKVSPGGVSSGSKAAPKPCPSSPTTHASLLPVFPQTLAGQRGLVPWPALRATVSGPTPPPAAQWVSVAAGWPLPDPLQENGASKGTRTHPGPMQRTRAYDQSLLGLSWPQSRDYVPGDVSSSGHYNRRAEDRVEE